MGKLEQLEKLGEVLALRVQQAQIDLAAINQEEAALRAALAQLARPVNGTDKTQTEPMEAFTDALAEMRWQRWAEARRTALHTNLAQLLARKADARQVLAVAIGKDAALTALVAQHRQAARRKGQ